MIWTAFSNYWYKSFIPKFLTEIFKIITRKKVLNGLPIVWTIRGSTVVGENIFSLLTQRWLFDPSSHLNKACQKMFHEDKAVLTRS